MSRFKAYKKIPKRNNFINDFVTDEVYKQIIDELKTNADGSKKKNTGRKRKLTREIFRDYIYYLSMTGEYAFSTECAGLPEKLRQKYMIQSETFRGVSTLAHGNIGLRAKITLSSAIEGREPGYIEIIHPKTKEKKFIEVGEIKPNVKAAIWYLETVEKIGKQDDGDEIPPLGAPQNEQEAELLRDILKFHTDYIYQKEAEKAQSEEARHLSQFR